MIQMTDMIRCMPLLKIQLVQMTDHGRVSARVQMQTILKKGNKEKTCYLKEFHVFHLLFI